MPRMRSAGAATARNRSTAPRSCSRSWISPPLRMISETVVRRDRSGRTVWLSEYSQSGTGWSRTEARIENGRAEISHRTRSERWTIGMPLPPDVRFDGGRGLLRGWDRRATPRLEFRDFNLGATAIDRVVIEAAPGAVPDAQGRLAVLRKRYRRELAARGRALAARPRQSHRRGHPAELRNEHHDPPDRPRDRAEVAAALLHAAQRPGDLALSDPGQCAAGAYPLPLRLSGRPRLRSAADRRAAGDPGRGAGVRRRHRRHLRRLRPRPCR